MNETSGDKKDNEGAPETNSKEPKKPVNLDDTISRLLRTKADAEAEEGEDTAD